MTRTAPTTVVLDLGNVLVRWDPRAAYHGRLAPDDVDAFFADVPFERLAHATDAGLPWAAARAQVQRSHPHHVAALDLYVTHFADSLLGPVPGMHALVSELRAAGVRLLGLTNWSAETFHHAEPAAPAIGLLEGVLVSGEVGLAKPDPAIFALLVERFDLDPAATVFVDDSPPNVAAGAAAGLDALLFRDAATLRRDLAARGLLTPAGDSHGPGPAGGERGPGAEPT
ncbi:HAD family hydrolase [Cellulomonas massiliensis]|uniref:HAD family hydrolase n=1 Tax=Cellulomonas massiliensis TaxID=1465811 RepID=UPI0002DBEF68|nr:HAD-IA family hydrolase [Cellulomonas massiliensis]